jgi:hypothetical protein
MSSLGIPLTAALHPFLRVTALVPYKSRTAYARITDSRYGDISGKRLRRLFVLCSMTVADSVVYGR